MGLTKDQFLNKTISTGFSIDDKTWKKWKKKKGKIVLSRLMKLFKWLKK